ncbi:MAG TPA: metal-dependent transcriptional regulator [Gemmatimonadales bacterium]|jgi:DtxR family Mn-dependent transcriptional regulator
MSAALGHEPLTRSVEDYLKAIYSLSPEGRAASTSDIAHRLELSAPSVSGMIKRLSEQGLLEHVPYKGVQLTAEGRRAALRMIRRHRILEAYLVARLGYTWDAVHEEAERLEHAVSDGLIERMAEALGNPDADPHGEPIPTAEGWVEEVLTTPLADIPAGETVEVRRVTAGDPDRLRYLGSVGLQPGVMVTVLERQPFSGPITIRVAEHERVIGHELAESLLCLRDQSA